MEVPSLTFFILILFPPYFLLQIVILKVVEGIVCMYSHSVQNRRVTLIGDSSQIIEDVMVGPEIQCRGCESHKHAMHNVLELNGCFDGFGAGADKACR